MGGAVKKVAKAGSSIGGALGVAGASGLFKGPSVSTEQNVAPGLFGTSREKGAQLGTTLENLLTSKQQGTPFAPTETQQQVLESLADFAQGQTAARGLGPATAGSIAQAVAPQFAQFAQQERQLASGRRGQDIAGLLELAGLAMPQTTFQQQQKSGGIGRSLLGGIASGATSAFLK